MPSKHPFFGFSSNHPFPFGWSQVSHGFLDGSSGYPNITGVIRRQIWPRASASGEAPRRSPALMKNPVGNSKCFQWKNMFFNHLVLRKMKFSFKPKNCCSLTHYEFIWIYSHEYPTLQLKKWGDPEAHMARDATLDPMKHQVDKEHKAFGPRGMAAIGSFSITAGYGNSQSSPLVKHQKMYTYPAHPILSRVFFFWNEVALKKKKHAFRFTTSSRRWLWHVYFPYISHNFCDPSRGICSIVPHPHGKRKLRHLRGETQVDTQVGCISDILCMDMLECWIWKVHSQRKTVGATSYFKNVATFSFLAIFPQKGMISPIHQKDTRKNEDFANFFWSTPRWNVFVSFQRSSHS